MRVLTAEQMQKVDAETIARVVPGIELMERAGRGVAQAIRERFTPARAAIVVGSGNNGGDGLVVARHLVDLGWSCSIHLLKPACECPPDTAANYQRVHGLSRIDEFNATDKGWAGPASTDLGGATVIIDSIFGTGFTGKPRESAAEAISLINRIRDEDNIPVISIDVPSGVNSTTGAVEGEAVRADLTLAIGCVKTGLLFHPGRSHAGELEVIDIGFPPEIVEKNSERVFYLGKQAAAAKLPRRAPDIHKYRAGTVLVIAGSERYRGAALLTAEAALRSGCGMLYLAVPEGIRNEIPKELAEAIVIALPQTREGTIAIEAQSALSLFIDKADAVAVGPGLDRNDGTGEFVRSLVTSCPKPLVVDADGLNALAGHADVLSKAKAPVTITPHVGELSRLTGDKIPATPLERIAYSRDAARRLGVTLVHKGAPTLISDPSGGVWINGSGSSALAKGGTGDVLTGFVASFLAQAAQAGGGTPALDAACVACWLHGRAAEFEASGRGERGVLASDLFTTVGQAMRELESV